MILVIALVLSVMVFAVLGLGSWVVAMSINDMLVHGVNLWNVLCILLVLVLLVGGSSKASN
jgi:hypothetical protein